MTRVVPPASQPPSPAGLAAAGIAGIALPAAGVVWLTSAPPAPMLALGMMGAGMIGAAALDRLRAGVVLALAALVVLIGVASVTGLRVSAAHLPALACVAAVGAVSFAVRGTLFARSAAPRGWWAALAVVAGEAAVLATAALRPDALPSPVLALLPTQWASTALAAAMARGAVAVPQLIALAGTAAATGLVIAQWPRRWTYGVMFSVWIGLSALVWHYG